VTQIKLPRGVLLARIEALPDPGAVIVELEAGSARVSLLLTRKSQRVAAFRNRCPHAGYPLQRADGAVLMQQGRYIVCGAHGASFTLEDGACAGGPCDGDALERIAITLQNGEIRTA
jgi:nitrite reductase/ring-hydroxylating ferredoxin subunit